jgi:hypothetical protein
MKVSERPACSIWAYQQDVICFLRVRVNEESEGARFLTCYSADGAYY